jgi:hypothetical protein
MDNIWTYQWYTSLVETLHVHEYVRIATALATEFGLEPICSTTSLAIAVTVVATH